MFNEMKGAMSSSDSQFSRALSKYVYPTSTYHHNSGGDPVNIPELTHQGLVRRCPLAGLSAVCRAACVSLFSIIVGFRRFLNPNMLVELCRSQIDAWEAVGLCCYP